MNHHFQSRRSAQAGFTLLELIVVVIIIGILAAVGAPKFFDFASKAEENAVKAVAANLASAAVLNYGACKLDPDPAKGCVPDVDTCGEVGSKLLVPPLSAEGKFTITPDNSVPDDRQCTVSSTSTSGSFPQKFPFPGNT